MFIQKCKQISCLVVTDSPIILSSFYANDPVLGQEFDALCTKVFDSYDSMNVFINRVKPYNPAGRFQTESESDQLATDLFAFLNEHGIACRHYGGSIDGYCSGRTKEIYNKHFHSSYY